MAGLWTQGSQKLLGYVLVAGHSTVQVPTLPVNVLSSVQLGDATISACGAMLISLTDNSLVQIGVDERYTTHH